MDNKNEILFAVKDAKKNLQERADFRVADVLSAFEGIAPFLDRETILKIKCKTCDYFAASSFPVSNDFNAVDNNKFCHAKRTSLKNLTMLNLAGCNEFSRFNREELANLVKIILEEDLKPAFAERKLYVRSRFASYKAAFRLIEGDANVYIEFGHETIEGFAGSGIRLYILRRLDPGFGPLASKRIADVVKVRPAIVVEASRQIRRQLDIDYVLEWIAKKRKMDIVYL